VTPRRQAAAGCLVGGLLTILGAAAIAALDAASDVPGDLYRAPVPRTAFLALAAYALLTHLVVLFGVLGLRDAETNRGARRALAAVAVAAALLAAAEIATMPLVDAHDSDTAATIVDSSFGIATIAALPGLLVAGRVARRADLLIAGALSLVAVPIQFTHQFWIGIGLYGLAYAVLGARAQARSV